MFAEKLEADKPILMVVLCLSVQLHDSRQGQKAVLGVGAWPGSQGPSSRPIPLAADACFQPVHSQLHCEGNREQKRIRCDYSDFSSLFGTSFRW